MSVDRMCWVMAAVLTVMIVWAHQAKAETNVFVGAWSEHLFSGEDLNEQHDLFAVEHNGYIAGNFVNSYGLDTVFVAKKWSWRYGELSAGVYGGLMRGYEKCYGHGDGTKNLCPLVAPYLTWSAGPVNPQIMLMGEAVAVTIRIGL